MDNKKYITGVLFFISIASGMNYNIISPTLLHLKSLMNCTLPEASFVFTARSAGYLVSAPIGAVLVKNSNRNSVLLIHTILMAVTVMLMPVASRIPFSRIVFYSAAGVNGICSGGLESIVNVWLLDVWEKRSTPFMQSLHFAFSFGCALAPIIAAKFLNDPTLVFYPYAITSAIVLFAALLLMTTFVKSEKKTAKLEEIQLKEVTADKVTDLSCEVGKKEATIRQQVILLSSFFLISYSGTSIIYNQFLPTYLQTSHSLTAEKSSYIHSALNYVSMMARAASIFATIRLPPESLLFFNLIMFNAGSIFLLLFSGMGEPLIWTGNVMVGMGMSGCTGLLYSFLHRHIRISHRTGSVFVFCNGLTSGIVPILIATLMTSHPLFLMWFNVVTITTAFLIFLVIYLVAVRYERNDESMCEK